MLSNGKMPPPMPFAARESARINSYSRNLGQHPSATDAGTTLLSTGVVDNHIRVYPVQEYRRPLPYHRSPDCRTSRPSTFNTTAYYDATPPSQYNLLRLANDVFGYSPSQQPSVDTSSVLCYPADGAADWRWWWNSRRRRRRRRRWWFGYIQ